MHTHFSPYVGFMKYLYSIANRSIFLLFLLVSWAANAQVQTAAPYSRFGLGELRSPVQATQMAMGGAGMALVETYKFNPLNPALDAFIYDPVFSIGVLSSFNTYKSQSQSFKQNNGVGDYVSLAMPIKRGRGGLAFGLMPYSMVSYSITSSYQSDSLSYDKLYQGDGGLYRAFFGAGYKIFSKVDSSYNSSALSIGVNGNFVFGNLRYGSKVVYSNTYSFNYREFNTTSVKDIFANAGIHYDVNLIKRTKTHNRYLKFLAAATFDPHLNLTAHNSQIAENFVYTSGNLESAIDTVSYTGIKRGTINIPFKLGVGIALDYVSNQRAELRFALDFHKQNWSELTETFDGQDISAGYTKDQQTVSAGLQYIPDMTSLKYFRKVTYSVGFHHDTGYLTFNNQAIENNGISFGVSLPINATRHQTNSAFNLAVDVGKKGTTAEGLIEQKYVKVQIGLSLTPNFRNVWLKKHKYD